MVTFRASSYLPCVFLILLAFNVKNVCLASEEDTPIETGLPAEEVDPNQSEAGRVFYDCSSLLEYLLVESIPATVKVWQSDKAQAQNEIHALYDNLAFVHMQCSEPLSRFPGNLGKNHLLNKCWKLVKSNYTKYVESIIMDFDDTNTSRQKDDWAQATSEVIDTCVSSLVLQNLIRNRFKSNECINAIERVNELSSQYINAVRKLHFDENIPKDFFESTWQSIDSCPQSSERFEVRKEVRDFSMWWLRDIRTKDAEALTGSLFSYAEKWINLTRKVLEMMEHIPSLNEERDSERWRNCNSDRDSGVITFATMKKNKAFLSMDDYYRIFNTIAASCLGLNANYRHYIFV